MNYFDTVDGKWWLFDDGVRERPLNDREAAQVVWGCKALICLECGQYKPDDERVQNGMKCGQCAY